MAQIGSKSQGRLPGRRMSMIAIATAGAQAKPRLEDYDMIRSAVDGCLRQGIAPDEIAPILSRNCLVDLDLLSQAIRELLGHQTGQSA
jgi:alkylhydroperoxidase/carboxymuconolactone decarboxylase family protein YurZ